MRNNILLSILIIFIIIGGDSTTYAQSEKEHFNYIKRILFAWENNGHSELSKILKEEINLGALPERLILNYWIFAKGDYNQRTPKLGEIKEMVNTYNINGLYGLTAKNTLSDIIELQKTTLTVLSNLNPAPSSFDEIMKAEKEETKDQGSKGIDLLVIPNALEYFVLRNDVLSIIKDESQKFLESTNDTFVFDESDKLISSTVTDAALIEHIMKRYINYIEKRKLTDTQTIVLINVDVIFSNGHTILIGSNDLDIIKNAYETKVNPFTGKQFKMVELIEPRWLLMRLVP